MSCSHCWSRDHNKRKCPDRDRPHEEVIEEARQKDQAFYGAANEIAKFLGKYPPEERERLAIEAFNRSQYEYQWSVVRPLGKREEAAQERFKIEVSKPDHPRKLPRPDPKAVN